jgi:hypothetical protein
MSRLMLSVAAALVGLGVTTADVSAKGARGGGRAERGHHGRQARNWSRGPAYPAYPAYAAPAVAAVPPAAAVEEAESEGPEEVMQVQCHLRVKNDTKEKLKVYVQYRTAGDDGEWAWLPADPKASEKAVVYELEPGEEAVLGDRGQAITASRVRVWAVAEASGSEWLDNKDADLWLVPEADDGQRYYHAAEMDSYTVTFSP